MEVKARIFTTSKTNWFGADFDYLRRVVGQAKGASLGTIDIKQITLPQSVPNHRDSDGDRKPDWDWFERTFTQEAREDGYNAAIWHLTRDAARHLLLTGYKGTYHDDPDDVFECIVICDEGQGARDYPMSAFAWLFLHELGHGFERWLYGRSSNRVHRYDYELHRLPDVYREFDFSIWNLRYQARNLLRILRDRFQAKAEPKSRYPTHLAPTVARRRDQLMQIMEAMGHPIIVTEEIRSCERQNELYGQGRSTGGEVVTNARCGESFHQYGVAFDVAFLKDGKPSWSDEHPWQLLGSTGEALGLEWGGRWTSLADRPHFQYLAGHSLPDFQAGNVDLTKL